MSKQDFDNDTAVNRSAFDLLRRDNEELKMKLELERLKKENEELKGAKAKGAQFTLKVSAKGAVSLYGLGRFPVTLYQEQWLKLLDHLDEIRRFIQENQDSLKKKNP